MVGDVQTKYVEVGCYIIISICLCWLIASTTTNIKQLIIIEFIIIELVIIKLKLTKCIDSYLNSKKLITISLATKLVQSVEFKQ